MKATGIVRRIDDLGRVVVPKEIRRTLHIREGDPLEIFTDREGGIVLRKYSPIGELSGFAKQYAEALAQASGHIVSITDRDQHIAVSGHGRKELLGKPVSETLEKTIGQRSAVCCQSKDKAFVPLLQDEDMDFKAQVIYPIIAEGDAVGSVIITSRNEGVKMGEVEQKLASAAASFLGRQMEQ
ncbi:MAG: stage V sporulation protein T [Clostridiales bacterium]|nr:stage V sporulation protein T [Clostridiales bacterium]MDY3746142.1 stage V sporulation protein T [Lachnospiraceae bacterium]